MDGTKDVLPAVAICTVTNLKIESNKGEQVQVGIVRLGEEKSESAKGEDAKGEGGIV